MGYLDPFPRGTVVSQQFGASPGGYNPTGGHTGRDYAVPIGTPIRAAADGVIRNSGWLTDNYMANAWWLTRMGGDILVLDCLDAAGRSETMPTFIYAHLSDSTAEVGARVRKGQIIGYSGNSGTATSGPHCHVEMLPPNWDWGNGTYGRINPQFTEYWDATQINPAGDTITPTTQEYIMAWTDLIQEYKEDGRTKAGPATKTAGFIMGNLNQWVTRILKGQAAIIANQKTLLARQQANDSATHAKLNAIAKALPGVVDYDRIQDGTAEVLRSVSTATIEPEEVA